SAKGDGVITGFGKIRGQPVFIYSQDFTISGGSVDKVNSRKICKIMDLALKAGAPIIGINDSGGAKIQDGVNALAGYGTIFQRNVNSSGIIPQISLIMGPCAGGAVYSPALTDFVFMVKQSSYMFVTGPNIVKKVLYEDITKEKLGGSTVHAEKSGVADLTFINDIEILRYTRQFIGLLPSNNTDMKRAVKSEDPLYWDPSSIEQILPRDSNLPYDIRHLLNKIIDASVFFEIQPNFAKNIVVGFARIYGQTIGIVANQPLHLSGCLDIDASSKAAKFIRFCDSFRIPLITFVDVPGFLPGREQEYMGVIKHGAKLLYAYSEATTPKITIITRKAYGGAYIVMNSKHLLADFNYAWETAEIAVMGAEGAVEIIHRKQQYNPEELNHLVDEYKQRHLNPYTAASKGFIDAVISPKETRNKIKEALDVLKHKNTERSSLHHNIPL
ncbi:propionyl-CoA carboxylase beta chain-like, partial [Symsagittifera roscoffensis]|uniref:propionyl-CoA carboxylase beta chain-like n=1 Tax=Symsagittifera roscoffensis TaxID=84072 RepID=UPI00307BC31C